MKFKVICGFPGSGKSTFVRKNIGNKDIVFDYDELISTITLTNKHIYNAVAHQYVLDFLENVLERGKQDPTDGTIWIIRTVPDESFKQKLADCDVSWFFINKTVFECMEQIENDSERKHSDKNWGAILMELQREGEQGKFDICTFINP